MRFFSDFHLTLFLFFVLQIFGKSLKAIIVSILFHSKSRFNIHTEEDVYYFLVSLLSLSPKHTHTDTYSHTHTHNFTRSELYLTPELSSNENESGNKCRRMQQI